MRALIVGCGYVGSELARMLAASGWEVWGLRRHAERLPPQAAPIAADVTRRETLHRIPRELDAVIYLVSAGATTEAAYRAAYIDGVRNVLAALGEGGGRPRLVFASSTAVYHQNEGEWVDEESPTSPRSFTGRLLLEGEGVVRAGDCESVIVRFGGIYGPGRARLIELIRRREARCREDPPRYTNRIHRDDCAGAIAHLLALTRPADLYLGVDHEPAPECEVMDWLAAQLGAPLPARASDSGGPRSSTSKRCRNDRLRASGYRFRYPTYREGYGALLSPGSSWSS